MLSAPCNVLVRLYFQCACFDDKTYQVDCNFVTNNKFESYGMDGWVGGFIDVSLQIKSGNFKVYLYGSLKLEISCNLLFQLSNADIFMKKFEVESCAVLLNSHVLCQIQHRLSAFNEGKAHHDIKKKNRFWNNCWIILDT